MQSHQKNLLPSLNATTALLQKQFDQIPPDRIKLLGELTSFIRKKINAGQHVYLNFICTHNSRRSHLAQLWAQTAAYAYDVAGVHCFSGGTEATAFNPRVVQAMKEAGFEIAITKQGENPLYEVRFATDAAPVLAFSKKYDDPFNHNKDFAAIMTCSHADENCPLVLGASARIAVTYDDPKAFDGTPLEEVKYKERTLQIGRDMLYAFSKVNS
jgi:arsenate reductase